MNDPVNGSRWPQASFGIFMAALLASCATHTAAVNDVPAVKIRPYQELTLGNGLRVLLVPDQSLPLVSVGVLLQTGTVFENAQDPQQAGIAAMTAEMLDRGTHKRSATQLADDFGQIASGLSVTPGYDSTVFSASSLINQRDKMLELFADAFFHPAFSSAELERLRHESLAALDKLQDNPSGYADILIRREVYAASPYGHLTLGTRSSLKALRSRDLRSFYQKNYRPENSFLFIAGSFDSAFAQQVEKIFSQWSLPQVGIKAAAVTGGAGNSPLLPAVLSFDASSHSILKLFTKPELKQAQIRFAEIAVRRSDPDYLPLRVANFILGGDFVSRLNSRVRDQLGLTYSIQSGLDPRLQSGTFEISTFCRNEKVAETITEVRRVLQDFVSKGVTAEELRSAQSVLIGQFPTAIETPEKLAASILNLRRYGVDDSYLINFNALVTALTVPEINAVIKRHFYPDNLHTIVFADQSKVLPQLQSLGPVDVHSVKAE